MNNTIRRDWINGFSVRLKENGDIYINDEYGSIDIIYSNGKLKGKGSKNYKEEIIEVINKLGGNKNV